MSHPRETTPRCGADTHRRKGTCKHPAGFGTDHVGFGRCKFHGGNSPSHQKNAAKLQVEARIAKYGNPANVEPGQELLAEVQRTAGHVRWLGDKIGQFMDDADLKQLTGGGPESWPKEVPAVWVQMYQVERGHLVRACKMAIDAGIAERQVRLAESQGELLAQVIHGILKDLGVDRKPETPEIVRRHLRLAASQ